MGMLTRARQSGAIVGENFRESLTSCAWQSKTSVMASFKKIAHRGASGHYPENSRLAFEKAIAAGADMIELDCQLSARWTCGGVPR